MTYCRSPNSRKRRHSAVSGGQAGMASGLEECGSSSGSGGSAPSLDPTLFQTPSSKRRRRSKFCDLQIVDVPDEPGEKGVAIVNKSASTVPFHIFFDGVHHCAVDVEGRGDFNFPLDADLRKKYPKMMVVAVQALFNGELESLQVVVPVRHSIRRKSSSPGKSCG
ncbi:hypothetical protein FOZ63_016653 [Perkinsus olseni]|uniref:Uncharacterized protein n=1 Tax=Perkinsus olseni TaxID=32597 RepID=A0A7J6R1M0_PEROL|nr:hypothetical protein FOZ62_015211 [Perkinsus olseni]KAF4751124.1 hypothetical protein FOZ63_016653 [Perkinsus olseni]